MPNNDGINRILDATTQAAPKMTAALSDYGDGRMGNGILNLMDWCTRQGEIKGAVIAGSVAAALGLASNLFLWRKVKLQEKVHNATVMDFLDELADTRKQLHKNSTAAPMEVEASSSPENVPLESATP